MIQFLTTGLWKSIAAESKKAKTKRAAIAYVTRDLPLSLGDEDTLIMDGSDGAIGSGQTSAAVLRKLHKRGVRLFSYPGLHAKTIVLDRTAFVSSGNLSDSSVKNLLEAGVRTDHPDVVSSAIGFIEDLADHAVPISERFLDRISKIPVTKKGFPYAVHRRRKLPKYKRDPITWLIGVHAIGEPKDPAEIKRVEKGVEKASEFLSNPKSSVSWVRYMKRSRLSKEADRKDNIVMIWSETYKSSPEMVYHHSPVLLNQPEPNCNRIFYEQFPNAERKALPWKKFTALVKRVGLPDTISKHSSRALDPQISGALHELWEQARGK
jgi:hypothetical protein